MNSRPPRSDAAGEHAVAPGEVRARLACALLAGVLVASVAPAAAAAGASWWRCGAEGRTFSDRPCPDGPSNRVVVRTDEVPEAARAEARAVAARERDGLGRLTAERTARAEAASVAPGALTAGAEPAPRRPTAAGGSRPSRRATAPRANSGTR